MANYGNVIPGGAGRVTCPDQAMPFVGKSQQRGEQRDQEQ